MPVETFELNGETFEIDPSTLTPEMKAKLRAKISGGAMPGVPQKQEAPKTGLAKLDKFFGDAGMTPGLADSSYDAATPVRGRLGGAALGGVMGGPLGAALGFVAPPRNAGDVAGTVLGAGAGRILGPIVQKWDGIKGIVGSALAGLAGHGAQQAGVALGGGQVDSSPVSAALSAVVPGAMKGLIQNPAASSHTLATVKSAIPDNTKGALKEILGKEIDPKSIRTMTDAVTPPSNEKGKNLLSDFGRVFGRVTNNTAQAVDQKLAKFDTAREELNSLKSVAAKLKEKDLSLKGVANRLKNEKRRGLGHAQADLDAMEEEYTAPAINNAMRLFQEGTKDLEENRDRTLAAFRDNISSAIDDRQKILAARRQVKGLKNNIPMDGPLDTNVPIQDIESVGKAIDDNRIEMARAAEKVREFNDLQIPRLKESLAKSSAIDPNLQHFVNNKVKNVDDFAAALESADPTNIVVLRKELARGHVGDSKPAAIKAFEQGFEKHFAKMAVGPDGELSNIEAASKAFDYNKIKAIYGGGPIGQEKANQFQRIVDNTINLMAEAKKADASKRIGMSTIGHVPYLLIRATFSSDPLTYGAKAAAAQGGAYIAASWPKMIAHAVKNPKFGKQFEEWAQDRSTAQTLKNYPLVEAYFRQNNEYKEKTPE